MRSATTDASEGKALRQTMNDPNSLEVVPGEPLNEQLRAAGLNTLDTETSRCFEEYLALILRWNARISLTSVRDADGIRARHFVESIVCARALPPEISTLLDFGSGAGFPGVPIALCRSDIHVTLAESQGKKAAFLREAIRTLGLPVTVHFGRAEALRTLFDCVVLRAVDRMSDAVSTAAGLVKPGGWMALMITSAQLAGMQATAGTEFAWEDPVLLPGSQDRIVALGARRV